MHDSSNPTSSKSNAIFDNKFILVCAAVKRAKELLAGTAPTALSRGKNSAHKSTVTALHEIYSGLVDPQISENNNTLNPNFLEADNLELNNNSAEDSNLDSLGDDDFIGEVKSTLSHTYSADDITDLDVDITDEELEAVKD